MICLLISCRSCNSCKVFFQENNTGSPSKICIVWFSWWCFRINIPKFVNQRWGKQKRSLRTLNTSGYLDIYTLFSYIFCLYPWMLPKSVFSTLPTPGLGIIFQELFSAIVPQGWCFDLVIAAIIGWFLHMFGLDHFDTVFQCLSFWCVIDVLPFVLLLYSMILRCMSSFSSPWGSFHVDIRVWVSIFVGIFLLKPKLFREHWDEGTASTWIYQCPILLSSIWLVPAVCSPH